MGFGYNSISGFIVWTWILLIVPISSCRAKVESIKKRRGFSEFGQTSEDLEESTSIQKKATSKSKSSNSSKPQSQTTSPTILSRPDVPPPVFTASDTLVHPLVMVSAASPNFRELQYEEGSNTLIETNYNPTFLKRYWKLNGDPGTLVPTSPGSILDFSGNSEDGQFIDGNSSGDATFQSAWLNQGIPLDGSDYLDLPIPNTSLQTQTGIISMWVKSAVPENNPQNHFLFEIFAQATNKINCRYSGIAY